MGQKTLIQSVNQSVNQFCTLLFPQVTEQIIQRLGLVEHADKRACDLSGGNKRKLSTAIALVGNPEVIFLVCSFIVDIVMDPRNCFTTLAVVAVLSMCLLMSTFTVISIVTLFHHLQAVQLFTYCLHKITSGHVELEKFICIEQCAVNCNW